MFHALIGVILVIWGLISPSLKPDMYQQHSLGININFWWGLVLTAFGLMMLALAWRASQRTKTP